MLFSKILPFLSLAAIWSTHGSAEPIKLFSAEEQCAEKASQFGPRFTLPCRNETLKLSPQSVPLDKNFSELIYAQRIEIAFSCEALRPVSISWSLEGTNYQGEAGVENEKDKSAFLSDFPSPSTGHTLKTQVKGFEVFVQSLKPGCEATLKTNTVYLEPKAFDQALSILKRENKVLGLAFRSATPDQSAEDLREALDTAIDTLDILSITADEVSLLQIEESLNKLQLAKGLVSKDCGAGSTISSCTEAQQTVRKELGVAIDQSENRLNALSGFLKLEKDRISTDSGLGDIAAAYETLLKKHFPSGN